MKDISILLWDSNTAHKESIAKKLNLISKRKDISKKFTINYQIPENINKALESAKNNKYYAAILEANPKFLDSTEIGKKAFYKNKDIILILVGDVITDIQRWDQETTYRPGFSYDFVERSKLTGKGAVNYLKNLLYLR